MSNQAEREQERAKFLRLAKDLKVYDLPEQYDIFFPRIWLWCVYASGCQADVHDLQLDGYHDFLMGLNFDLTAASASCTIVKWFIEDTYNAS